MNDKTSKALDILAIGDLVIDAFIRLKEAEVHCTVNHENCELCVKFGQKIPYESVTVCNAVGNSPNAAVSAARLGLVSGLLSYVGNDKHGEDCIDSLQKDNVDISYVHTEDGKTTNYHYVLWYDVDRTILIKHEKFDYTLEGVTPPKWLYLSSLGEHTLPFHAEVAKYLAEHEEIKLAFQPGTFQIKFGTDALKDIYARSQIVCCNVEESQVILKEESRDLKTLLKGMNALGPKKVLITDGINGAYAYDSEAAPDKFYFMPVYPHVPFEITGAGDAFFSTIVSALSLDMPFLEALRWGPINAMSVSQQIGAQKGLLTREKLEEFLSKAPADYVAKEI